MVDFSVAFAVVASVVRTSFSVVGIEIVEEGSSPFKKADIKFDVLCISVEVTIAIDAGSVETLLVTVDAFVTTRSFVVVVK